MIKTFVTLPGAEIRQKSDEVIGFDKSVASVVRDLIETAEAQSDPIALGLAAPQIGIKKRIFVARIRNKFKHFVNPTITKYAPKETSLMEGCFSVPKLYGNVMRPAEVEVKYFDMYGKQQTTSYKGLTAKIIQHELDHLNGILFIDHTHEQNGKTFRVQKDKKGNEEFVEAPIV